MTYPWDQTSPPPPDKTPEEVAKLRLEGAYDRGDSDRYYGRYSRPNIRYYSGSLKDDTFRAYYVVEADMTPEELAAFDKGYDDNPSGRKDWG